MECLFFLQNINYILGKIGFDIGVENYFSYSLKVFLKRLKKDAQSFSYLAFIETVVKITNFR